MGAPLLAWSGSVQVRHACACIPGLRLLSGLSLYALQSILQRLQQCITLTVLEEGQVNNFMHHAMELMSYFHEANQQTHHVPLAAFYNDAGPQPEPPSVCALESRNVSCFWTFLWTPRLLRPRRASRVLKARSPAEF